MTNEASDKIATGLNEAGAEATKAFAEGVEAAMDTLQDAWTADMSLPEALQALGALSDIAHRIPPRRAPPEAALPVAVKGLRWLGMSYAPDKAEEWIAHTPFETLQVYLDRTCHEGWQWVAKPFPPDGSNYPTKEAAQEALRRHYEARIRSALVPAPLPVAVKEWAEWIEAAAKVADAIASDDGDIAARGFRTGEERARRQAGAEIAAAIRALAALSQPERGKAEPSEAEVEAAAQSEMLRSTFDAAIKARALAHPPGQPLPRYRHKKRGTEYEMLGIGVMQAEGWYDGAVYKAPGGHPSVDMRPVAIYRALEDGSLWARPREEFEDGRFEPVAALQSKEGER